MRISDMNKKIRWIAALAISGFVMLLVLNRFSSGRGSLKLQAPTDSAEEMQLSSFFYRSKKNGLISAELEADDFAVVPKKFFVFQVASVNEAIMTNARVFIYLDRSHDKSGGNKVSVAEDPIGSLFKEFTGRGGEAGLISSVTVNGIEIKVFDGPEILKYHLKASRAELGDDSGGSIFYEAALEQPLIKKQIRADRLFWDYQKRKFRRI